MTSARRPDAYSVRLAGLLVVGYALLTLAWLMANPPFSALDEGAHYARAVGLGGGQLIGGHGSYEPAEMPSLTPEQLEWVNRSTRVVTLPGELAAYGGECGPLAPEESAACLHEAVPFDRPVQAKTYVGAYVPAPYVLPGLAARVAPDWNAAVLLGRAAAAATFVALVALGLLALAASDREGATLAGVLVGLTPMALFVGASLNPNGTETAAGIAFTAGLIALTRLRPPPTWVWLATIAAGTLLALSRTTGPLWLALSAVAVAALVGARHTWRVARDGGVWAVATVVALAAAVAANRAWEERHMEAATFSLRPLRPSLEAGVDLMPYVFREIVGIFGAIAVPLPPPAYALWAAAVGGLLAAAWIVGRLRERVVLALAAAAGIALPPLFYAALYRHTGFGMAGRYFLPILPVVPLLAGAVAARAGADVRRLLALLAPAAAMIHLVGWYLGARRAAVGLDGPLFFPPAAEWSPPIGWWPWLLCAAAGAALIAVAPLVALPARRARREGEYVVVSPLG